MLRTINELRKRPEHHRRRIALGVSAVVTGLIFIIWLSVLSPLDRGVVARSETREREDGPIDTIKRGVAQTYEAIRGLISETQETVNLQAEYERIRNQVESGEIKLTPDSEISR